MKNIFFFTSSDYREFPMFQEFLIQQLQESLI